MYEAIEHISQAQLRNQRKFAEMLREDKQFKPREYQRWLETTLVLKSGCAWATVIAYRLAALFINALALLKYQTVMLSYLLWIISLVLGGV